MYSTIMYYYIFSIKNTLYVNSTPIVNIHSNGYKTFDDDESILHIYMIY